MSGYVPLKITGNTTGLVQNRQEFILPDDAYPILENAVVFREQLKRKDGNILLGRFRRLFSSVSLGNSSASPWSFNLFSTVSPAITEPNAQLEIGKTTIVVGAVTFIDQGDGTLSSVTPLNSGTINYNTGDIQITTTQPAGTASTVSFNYFPGLPVMGLRNRDTNAVNTQLTIGFDTKYAYIYSNGWQEYIPGTTWSGLDYNFFWSTNYWFTSVGKLFWVTNFSGLSGDPIRYTDGVTWYDFGPSGSPVTGKLDATNYLTQCLCMLPYRSRLVCFNTYEGPTLAGSTNFPQRIRFSKAGANPLSTNSWRDNTRGDGGSLDIPTNEQIVSVGFVQDNVVIYCSRSTWQLRYTGRSISPFQVEKVNSELGAESTFSGVQFDTNLVGIGDKGIVQCDSYKSEKIDIKIPDLVFSFNAGSQGTQRVHGIRDFEKRLAYWTYPYQPRSIFSVVYPNRRLVRNYENDSWAIFTDSLTCLGTFYPTGNRKWENTNIAWQSCDFRWNSSQSSNPTVIGGNQQGYVLYLDQSTTNDQSLTITDIQGNATTATVITSPSHNLSQAISGPQSDRGNFCVVEITGIAGSGYSNLNDNIYGAFITGANTFELWQYDPVSDDFVIPQLDPSASYIGGGQITIREGFYIQSKKFNYIEKGESIQMGYMDVLMDATSSGAITLNVLANYNDDEPVNLTPQNIDDSTGQPDPFFNSVVSTANPNADGVVGTKYWQRVYCPARANFLTIVWSLSNAQLVGEEQEEQVQIDAQVLWQRPAGRMSNQ